ncbi:MAG TPA: transporter [Alphaproteobacteria bacterium]|nr:transporter [Alphaproteobacteria bacterium]
MSTLIKKSKSITVCLATLLGVGLMSPVAMADDSSVVKKLDALTQLVEQQQTQLQGVEQKLESRQKQIDELKAELKKWKKQNETSTVAQQTAPGQKTLWASRAEGPNALAAIRGAGEGSAPPQEVGEKPAQSDKPPAVPLLADVGGVLTPRGTLIVEPFIDYSRSSVNTFSFEGIQVVPAFLIGNISASRTARDLLISGSTFRLGVTNRLELEAKVPFVWRQDSYTNVVPNSTGLTTTQTSNGEGLGDVEVAAHYQVNNGQDDWPFFIANMRLKTDTGTSPYEVPYNNSTGLPTKLATGSGFIAVEPSVTAIYPTDPAILFANIGYIHSFDEDINRTIAGNAVGNVAPGDTYTASLGMGVALNDRVSFTLGYEQDYVQPTATVVGGVTTNSDTLMIGSALTGFSYKVNDRTNVNFQLAAGVTRDAPDVEVVFRVPVAFSAF